MKDWVKELTRLRGYTDQMVEDANAVIFTFGSYRLGVRSLHICLAVFIITTIYFIGGVCSGRLHLFMYPLKEKIEEM